MCNIFFKSHLWYGTHNIVILHIHIYIHCTIYTQYDRRNTQKIKNNTINISYSRDRQISREKSKRVRQEGEGGGVTTMTTLALYRLDGGVVPIIYRYATPASVATLLPHRLSITRGEPPVNKNKFRKIYKNKNKNKNVLWSKSKHVRWLVHICDVYTKAQAAFLCCFCQTTVCRRQSRVTRFGNVYFNQTRTYQKSFLINLRNILNAYSLSPPHHTSYHPYHYLHNPSSIFNVFHGKLYIILSLVGGRYLLYNIIL